MLLPVNARAVDARDGSGILHILPVDDRIQEMQAPIVRARFTAPLLEHG